MDSRISNDEEPQFPVVCAELRRPAGRKVAAHCVEAVRPLGYEPERSRGNWNDFQFHCSDSDASDNDVLSVGAIPPTSCSAKWSGTSIMNVGRRYVEEEDHRLRQSAQDQEIADIDEDVYTLSDVLPARSDDAAIRPRSLPVGGSTRPQIMQYPDEPDVINVQHKVRKRPNVVVVDMVKTAGVDNQNIRNTMDAGGDVLDVPDVFPVELEVSANEPMSLQVETDMGQQVEVGWEPTLMAAPLVYKDGHMTEWPDIKSDGVLVNDIMLESEMSPVGSVLGAAEPALLATKSEVFSPVVLAGGRCCGSPTGRGRGSHSASFCPTKLPIILDATVVDTEQLVNDLGDTLDAVDEGAGQLCVHIVPAELSPNLHDVRSVGFNLWPFSQFFLSYEDSDEDWLSPMIGGRVPLPSLMDLDYLYMSPQKTDHSRKLGPHTAMWDWRSILKNVASSTKLPELLDLDCQDRFRNLGRRYVLDLCVLETDSDIQPLGGGYIESDDSPFESCGREMISDVRQPGGGCMVLNDLPFIPYCRRVIQFSHPMVEKINCTRVRGCAGNGHSPGVSKNETTPAEIVRSTELCVRKETARFG